MRCPCEECLKLAICKVKSRSICKDLEEYLFMNNGKHIEPLTLSSIYYYVKNIRFARFIGLVRPEIVNFKERLNPVINEFKYGRKSLHRKFRYFVDFWFIEIMIIVFKTYKRIKKVI